MSCKCDGVCQLWWHNQLTSGCVQQHLEHGTRSKRGTDNVRDGLCKLKDIVRALQRQVCCCNQPLIDAPHCKPLQVANKSTDMQSPRYFK